MAYGAPHRRSVARKTVVAQRYTIRTVSDFLRVPAARRQRCLDEFAGWLAHAERNLVRHPPLNVDLFIWTDDGVGGTRVEPADRSVVTR